MRYLALACDYDSTLAREGRVGQEPLAALGQVLDSGRRLVLVTGRELPDLMAVFPHLDLFERVVAENGALLYRPQSRDERLLADPPPDELVSALRERGVEPLSVGRTIVATREPHETAALDVIRELGLEHHVVFNKGSVMILPAGVNKGAGLQAALEEMGLSPHNVVGIGDAENDHAFLSLCECSAAVSNALPMVKERADIVTEASYGDGVMELVRHLLSDDLGSFTNRLVRHDILLGTKDKRREVRIKPYGTGVLLAGPSGSGKATVALALLERLAEHRYQFCLIDPEGDYESFEDGVVLGDGSRPPSHEEVLQLLRKPAANVVVNLVGLPLHDRPAFFAGLLPRLQDLRTQTGRPHWLVVDEAHHLLPVSGEAASKTIPQEFGATLLITVHPDHVAPAALSKTDVVIAVGDAPAETLKSCARALGQRAPNPPKSRRRASEVVAWFRRNRATPFRVQVAPARAERRRHQRKYAEGDLGPGRSFYFRGPDRKLKLRAQNLMLFAQIADGVDDETWLHHLRHRDYSRWFRETIKDDGLAAVAETIEQDKSLSPAQSRERIKQAITERYSAPALVS